MFSLYLGFTDFYILIFPRDTVYCLRGAGTAVCFFTFAFVFSLVYTLLYIYIYIYIYINKDIEKFIIGMLEKIFEKSMLGSSLVRAATILNPDLLLELSKQKLIDRLKVLLKRFMALNIFSATQWDQVRTDFSTFYRNKLKDAKDYVLANNLKPLTIQITNPILMMRTRKR